MYAADAGVLIELVLGGSKGQLLKESMKEGVVSLFTHELALVETRYILCRRIGRSEAWAKVENLLSSGYLIVEDVSNLLEEAASLKCERKIALPDCFTLALASKMGIRALFATKEVEIIKEMEKNAFEVDLVFL